jgi:6-phosphogluconolactonase
VARAQGSGGRIGLGRRAIVIHPSRETLLDDAAAQIETAIDTAVRARGRAFIVLTGGSTIPPVYERLARSADIDWNAVELFWSDERCVPPDDPDSNYGMTREILLQPARIPDANVHRFDGEEPDRDRAVRAYAAEIESALGDDSRFDLIVLGMGADAHIASLFPGHPLIDENERWTGAVSADDFDIPKPAIDRLTLTPRALHSAREVLLVVISANKAPAVHGALGSVRDPQQWPAQLVDGPESRVTWLLDSDAATEIEGEL